MDWNNFFNPYNLPVIPYSPGLREEQIREICEVDTIYKLSSNESPFSPFPSALKAMAECLPLLNEYSDGSSHALTMRLAEHYGVEPEQIMVGNGSNELLCLIAQSCLMPEDEVVYCWPSFVVYRSSTQLAGATAIEVPLTEEGVFDLDAMAAAITDKTKLVFICSPNNPSGGVISAADFDAFINKLPDHVLLVLDIAYIEFVDDEDAIDFMRYFDGVRPLVILKTFSKMYSMAGIRCGYGIAPKEIVEAFNRVREPFNVNSVAQAGALACFDETEEIARRRALNSAGKQQLYQCFDELGLSYYRSGANFIWVHIPNAAERFNQLLKMGIIVRAVPGAEGLRVGVGDEEGVRATIDAFKQLFGKTQ
ncbi:MAG: histidinol-phosphate transaminase [Coriobacteriaceae bacterium]|nr:histidinol-phosphate transaminase [Coriobacteriaceae bacterium]